MNQSIFTPVRPARAARQPRLAASAYRLALLLFALAALAGQAWAQSAAPRADASLSRSEVPELEALLAHGLAENPSIRAAEARIEAARAGIGPAGMLPDPMLMAGIMNQAMGGSEGDNMMAMRTLGVGQTLPYPGKLALQRRVAEADFVAAEAEREGVRWAVVEEIKKTYYRIAFLDQALDIVRRNEKLLRNFVQVTQSRYGVGTGSQADLLKARVESARLAEEAVVLAEERRAALARLNAVLDRPSDAPVSEAPVPTRVARAAVPENAREIQFTSATLGARAANSPLPPLAEVQEAAVRENPMLRAHQARIAAQAARVELARKAHLPDFDVSVQYGQRSGHSDVVSATLSVPIPLRKGQRQDLGVKEAEAELAAIQAERHAKANEIRSQVAQAYSEMEQERAQLALFVKSIIPQGRAALESATASFQVGRVDFLTLLENQGTLYNYEIAYHRSLTGFAARLAELERMAGKEILR